MTVSRKHARLPTLGSRVGTFDPSTALAAPKRADQFYLSQEWRELIARLIRQRGRRCEACPQRDCRLIGDHVVELQDGGAPLDPANVQLLCQPCHNRKTARRRADRMAEKPSRAAP